MLQYLRRRLTDLLITVLGVLTIVFVVLRLSGDPLALLAPQDATQEQLDTIRREYGLDRPLAVQYLHFLGQVVSGDLGRSLQFQRPSAELVAETFPATLELTVAALCISALVAIPAGTLAAFWRGRWVDRAVTTGTLVGQSMPYFWLGILLIMAFAVRLRWVPTSGRGTLLHLVLPAITLSAASMARSARLVRAEMLGVLRQDFIRTAWAKGLAPGRVLFGHALRNAAIPVITTLALDFGVLLGGAVVTETIFAWPGLGRLIVQAIMLRDYPLVQAGVLYLSVAFVMLNAGVDALYVVLDPRIRRHA